MITFEPGRLGNRASSIVAGGVALCAVLAGQAVAAPGDLDAEFAPQLDGQVGSVAVQGDGKVLIGGGFTRVGGVNRERAARLHAATGALDATFTLTSDALNSFGQTVLPNGNVLVYGDFTRLGSVNRSHLAMLTPNGALVGAFNPGPDASVFTVQPLPDGKFFIGGAFSEVGGLTRRQIARLQTNGTLDSAFNLPANGSVLTSALLPDNRLVVGGSFTAFGSQTRERLAILRQQGNGSSDATFTPSFNGTVFCVAIQPDGKILAGGSFTTVNGTPRRHLARLHPDGSLDTGFHPDLTGTGDGRGVFSVVVQCDGRILFSGNGFSTVSGVGRTQIARVEADGRLDSSFNPFLENPGITFGIQNVFTTVQGDGRVLISGSFAVVNGQPRRGLARLQNDPAVSDLTATAADRVEWRRGGSAPETLGVEFDLSTDGGRTWSPLGRGSRIEGGWELAGLSLPASGHLRARTPVLGARFNGSASLLETTVPFALPTRVLAVHDGPSVAAPMLSDGQTEAVTYGETRQGTPVTRAFALANAGTVAFQITGFSAPGGFRIFNLPTLPRTLEPGQSLTIPVQLTATASGTFEGPVVITSTADDTPEFRFPLTGLVVTPEIAVFAGSGLGGAEVTSGQATAIDFERNVQGTPGVRTFTVANQGSASLLVFQLAAPPGFEIQSGSLPAEVAVGESLEFQVRLTTLTIGVHAGPVRIDSDDLDEPAFEFPVVGEVFIPAPVATLASERTTLNRQTGLREQTVLLSNDTTATVPAYQLRLTGLPAGVTVANATEVAADGSIVVLVRESMGPFSAKSIVLEYRSADRQPEVVSPHLVVEVVLVPPDDTAPDQPPYTEVARIATLPNGSVLLEIASLPGRHYEFHYSVDGTLWKRSPAHLPATGNRTQWIDRGPPRTDRPPAGEPTRFYRVREMTP